MRKVVEAELGSKGMPNEISKAQVAQPGREIIFRKIICKEILTNIIFEMRR